MENVARIKIRENEIFKEVHITDSHKPEISDSIIEKWQNILNLMTKIMNVPSSLIMKLHNDTIEVFLKNTNRANPYKAGAKESLGLGLYCETVVGHNDTLLVPNAIHHTKWADNPDVKFNMISYLGMPIKWPDQEFFGTICVLDNKENSYHTDLIELMRLMKLSVEADLNILLNNAHLQKLSITDTLTKLYNRFEINHILNQYFEQFKRYGKIFSIMLLDIDDFKKINDTYGHLFGDKILMEFAEIIKNNMRQADLPGRWGGEEFIIVCPETDLENCQKLALKLLTLVKQHIFENNIRITTSIGMTTSNSAAKSYNDLIKAADDALYLSKAKGKNQIEIKIVQ